MELTFIAIASLTVDFNPSSGKTTAVESRVDLDFTDEMLVEGAYRDKEGRLNKDGLHTAINVMAQGIINCITVAHEKGLKKDFEYLQYVIDELGRAFAHPKKEING